jgi:hypothetical protein
MRQAPALSIRLQLLLGYLRLRMVALLIEGLQVEVLL